MAEIIYGTLLYKDNPYPFFLDEGRVFIVGEAWKYYKDFKNADYEETICGVTSGNQDIMFLHCEFGMTYFQQRIWFTPVGYILSCGNTGNPYDFTFEKLSFYAEAINSFFPPQEALSTDIDPNNWDGSMTMTFKPFKETAKEFNFKECKCKINISRSIIVQKGGSDIGNIDSEFAFEFNTEQHSRDIPQYWLALFDFLSFVNYGTDITFRKIELSKRRKDGKFMHCANAVLFSNSDEYVVRPITKRLTANDIPSEKLGAIYTKIAMLRESDNRLPYYFPENPQKRRWIDATQWFVMAMNFDGLFASCYPNFKQNKKVQFRKAKTESLNALSNVDKSTLSKKECEYFDDCYNQVLRYEGLLEEKMNFIINKYKNALDDILNYNQQKNNMKVCNYGKVYRDYRNKIAHGDVQPIGDKEKAVYIVLQAVIYFLLLEEIELDDDTLKIIAKKLFL